MRTSHAAKKQPVLHTDSPAIQAAPSKMPQILHPPAAIVTIFQWIAFSPFIVIGIILVVLLVYGFLEWLTNDYIFVT